MFRHVSCELKHHQLHSSGCQKPAFAFFQIGMFFILMFARFMLISLSGILLLLQNESKMKRNRDFYDFFKIKITPIICVSGSVFVSFYNCGFQVYAQAFCRCQLRADFVLSEHAIRRSRWKFKTMVYWALPLNALHICVGGMLFARIVKTSAD